MTYKPSNLTTKSKTKIHRLKIYTTYFHDVKNGIKTFEVRNNDRNYKVGDILLLREYLLYYEYPWGGYEGEYSENYVYAKITYIFADTCGMLRDGYVVLGIKVI